MWLLRHVTIFKVTVITGVTVCVFFFFVFMFPNNTFICVYIEVFSYFNLEL